jgi:cytochrome c-type biogenesis protein CcmF
VGQRVLYRTVLSREWGLLASLVLFIAIALIVGVGTSLPVITLLPFFPTQQSVDLSFYGPTIAPFGLLLLLTMAVGPLLGWQHSKYGSLLRLLRWPAILTAVVLFACLLLNITYPLALLFVGAAVFAVATNAAVIRRIWRAGPLRLGGYLCHIGAGLLFVGVIGTVVYKQTASLQLTADAPQTAFGRQFVFRGMVLPPDDELKRTAVQVEVTNPATGSTWVAEAPYYVFPKSGQLVIHPAIERTWWSDLYLEPSQYLPPVQEAPGKLLVQKEIAQQAFGYTVRFEEFVIDRAAMQRGELPTSVGVALEVTAPNGTTSTITPTMAFGNGQEPVGTPVALQDGVTLTLLRADPNSQTATVAFGGVDLGTVPPDDLKPRLFLEVSRKPGITLVWGGIIIGVLGGLLALLRRWREGYGRADAPPVPLRRPAPRRPQPSLQPEGQLLRAEHEVQG